MRKLTTLELVLLIVLSVAIFYIILGTMKDINSFRNERNLYDKLIASQEDYVRSLVEDKKQLKQENIKIKKYYVFKKDSIAALSGNELHNYITDFLSN